jgi:hypothetical protein
VRCKKRRVGAKRRKRYRAGGAEERENAEPEISNHGSVSQDSTEGNDNRK